MRWDFPTERSLVKGACCTDALRAGYAMPNFMLPSVCLSGDCAGLSSFAAASLPGGPRPGVRSAGPAAARLLSGTIARCACGCAERADWGRGSRAVPGRDRTSQAQAPLQNNHKD